MLHIGLISDTHDHFDALLPQRFAGVDRILHAGDIGSLEILARLEEIAPVTAVAGNCDGGLALPSIEWIQCAGSTVLLQHIVNPNAPSVEFLHMTQQAGVDIVVFGHTHRPFSKEQDGILFVNPGYAGKPRFHLPRSVAILSMNGRKPSVELLHLP